MNINPNAKRILVFSDSLGGGYIPASSHERYPANVRWTGKLQELLGDGYEVIEECLNSRGILTGDNRPGKEGRAAIDYITPCLDSHDPLDYVVVLLGTNELKYAKQNSASDVAGQMKELLGVIAKRPSQYRDTKPELVLLSPPIINEETDYAKKVDKYRDAHAKSKELTEEYKALAGSMGIKFLNLADIVQVGKDGVHLDAESHKMVAKKLQGYLNKII